MLISEVIKKLQEIQEQEGDIKVCCLDLDSDVHEDISQIIVQNQQFGWKSDPRKETEKVVSIYS